MTAMVDLLAAGIPEEQIPADPAKRTDAHRMVRVAGGKVRAPEKLLTDVKDKYVAWRGGTPTSSNPAPRAANTRAVVDRQGRRQAIPSHPGRRFGGTERRTSAKLCKDGK
jgi:hypothetical protein